MTRRTEQLASSIRRAVQTLLSRGLNDPRVRGLVSVTSVKLSEDLADATIFVSILPAKHEDLTMHGLRQAAGHLQAKVGRSIRSRRLPRLSFRLDQALKKQAAVDAAIACAAHGDVVGVTESEAPAAGREPTG